MSPLFHLPSLTYSHMMPAFYIPDYKTFHCGSLVGTSLHSPHMPSDDGEELQGDLEASVFAHISFRTAFLPLSLWLKGHRAVGHVSVPSFGIGFTSRYRVARLSTACRVIPSSWPIDA